MQYVVTGLRDILPHTHIVWVEGVGVGGQLNIKKKNLKFLIKR